MPGFFTRHQPAQPLRGVVLAGLGGLLAIGLIGALTAWAQTPLLMAPFGASCVLLFSAPSSPFSQPANLVGGHLAATLVGLLLRTLLPDVWWAAALAVGLAIAVMAALRVTHPPAGADPLVVFAEGPGMGFLLMPVLAGACALLAVATLFHRANGVVWPLGRR